MADCIGKHFMALNKAKREREREETKEERKKQFRFVSCAKFWYAWTLSYCRSLGSEAIDVSSCIGNKPPSPRPSFWESCEHRLGSPLKGVRPPSFNKLYMNTLVSKSKVYAFYNRNKIYMFSYESKHFSRYDQSSITVRWKRYLI